MVVTVQHNATNAGRVPAGFLRALCPALRGHARWIALAALVAAAGVFFSGSSREPVFCSDALVTTLFDNDRGASIALDLTGARGGVPSSLETLISRPRGRLFPVILSSRSVGLAVLSRGYSWNDGKHTYRGSLYDELGTQNADAALIALRSRIASFHLDPETGATRISVRTAYPELSWQIANAFVEELAGRLNALRDRRIDDNLRIVRGKIQQVAAELAAREEELHDLRSENRNYRSARHPALAVGQIRLEREIDMLSSVYTTLESQEELIAARRLDRARRVTVVSPARIPRGVESPSWRRLAFLSFASAAVVFLLCILAVVSARCIDGASRDRIKRVYRLIRIDARGHARSLRRVTVAARRAAH